MYCRKCGNALNENVRFCNQCGTEVISVPNVVKTEEIIVELKEEKIESKASDKIVYGLVAGTMIISIALIISLSQILG